METKKTKKEIVKMLLNKDFHVEDDDELYDLLVDQPISIDVDKVEESKLTKGDKMADKLTAFAGSWRFIIGFVLFLLLWILLNAFVFKDLDEYPFILLNLLLSCVAALQAPIIMMSQNRAAEKDSLRNANDYKVDLKSELILEELHNKIDRLVTNQNKIIKYIQEMEDKKEKK